MLTREEIQVLIVKRLVAAHHSCNSYHINHVEGQVRALVAVLNDGKSPPALMDTGSYLTLAGIPWGVFDESGNGWRVDPQWLLDRGCTVATDDEVKHPRLQGEW